MPVEFEGTRYDLGFRADLIVEDCVIVEVKSVSELLPVHQKQLLTYLRFGNKKLGLLLNFNVALLKHGICRIANGI
jgi:GxxExxY protein